MPTFHIPNGEIAETLEQIADLLEVEEASAFRVRAYREAARTVRKMDRSVVEILRREGTEGLVALPTIGRRLAAHVEELVHTGRVQLLDRLLGEVSVEDLFSTVPGIGKKLAGRLHRELGVETLEQLELAAHDGRLERVPGFGARRSRLLRDELAAMLGRAARSRARFFRGRTRPGDEPPPAAPPLRLLFAVDERYRRLAEAGRLRKIAPRRFNPEGKTWLPIMQTTAEGWSFTVMYSNTARAHQLGRTHDWVVIYHERDGREAQCTVVTETHGPQRGRRVVRGREVDSAA